MVKQGVWSVTLLATGLQLFCWKKSISEGDLYGDELKVANTEIHWECQMQRQKRDKYGDHHHEYKEYSECQFLLSNKNTKVIWRILNKNMDISRS